jgi:sporulation protein YlmC with PRC-barrel domain
MEAPNPLIMSARIKGTDVYTREGQRMGYVHELSIEKSTGRVAHVILAVGGFLGLGERLHPVPWGVLEYHVEKDGFVVSIDWRALKDAPSLHKDELEALGAGETWRDHVYDYYGRHGPYTD